MRIVIILLSALLVGSCETAGGEVTSDTLAAIASGALVIDVRTPAEFNEGHFPGAINIPHEKVIEGLRHRGTKPDRAVVVYCHSGNRSGKAEAMLVTGGFSRVKDAGGLEALLAATGTKQVLPAP